MYQIINLLSITDKCHKTVCFIYPSLLQVQATFTCTTSTQGGDLLYNMDGLDQLLLGFFGISCLLLLIYGIIYVICLTCHSVGLMPSRFSNKVSSPATNINRYLHTLLYCVQDHYSKLLINTIFSVTRFILNLQQPLRNLPSMFEPFTVITALTVTAATFGILSIISDYCLNYYRLKNKQKKGKFFLNVSPYYVTTLSPQYVDMSYTKCLRYILTLSATMSPQIAIFLSTKTETFANITKLQTSSQ